jgi:hypothetical protein
MLFITLGDGPMGQSPRPTNKPTDWCSQPCVLSTLHAPDPSRTPIEPTDPMRQRATQLSHFMVSLCHFAISSAIFWFWLVICSRVNHFAIVNSPILLQWTRSFLLQCSFILWFYQSFCYNKLNYFCYSELNHFDTLISHFMILSTILEILSSILLQC